MRSEEWSRGRGEKDCACHWAKPDLLPAAFEDLFVLVESTACVLSVLQPCSCLLCYRSVLARD